MCMAYEPKKENWKQDLYFLKNCLQTRRFVYLDAMERALALLSILTIFSALIDCWSYIDEVADDLWVLRQPLSAWPGQIIAHAVFSGVLILVALIVVGSLWLDFRKRK